MYPFLIHLGNAAFLAIMLVGVPAVTSLQLGKIQLSATPEFQMLTLGGLVLGATTNLVGGALSQAKSRRAFWKWLIAHGALLTLYYLVFEGHLKFDWLKDALLWLKKTVT